MPRCLSKTDINRFSQELDHYHVIFDYYTEVEKDQIQDVVDFTVSTIVTEITENENFDFLNHVRANFTVKQRFLEKWGERRTRRNDIDKFCVCYSLALICQKIVETK